MKTITFIYGIKENDLMERLSKSLELLTEQESCIIKERFGLFTNNKPKTFTERVHYYVMTKAFKKLKHPTHINILLDNKKFEKFELRKKYPDHHIFIICTSVGRYGWRGKIRDIINLPIEQLEEVFDMVGYNEEYNEIDHSEIKYLRSVSVKSSPVLSESMVKDEILQLFNLPPSREERMLAYTYIIFNCRW